MAGPCGDSSLPAPGRAQARRSAGRLRQGRSGLKLADQPVVGERLAERVPGVERPHEKQQHDGDVVRRAEYRPKLVKIHKNWSWFWVLGHWCPAPGFQPAPST